MRTARGQLAPRAPAPDRISAQVLQKHLRRCVCSQMRLFNARVGRVVCAQRRAAERRRWAPRGGCRGAVGTHPGSEKVRSVRPATAAPSDITCAPRAGEAVARERRTEHGTQRVRAELGRVCGARRTRTAACWLRGGRRPRILYSPNMTMSVVKRRKDENMGTLRYCSAMTPETPYTHQPAAIGSSRRAILRSKSGKPKRCGSTNCGGTTLLSRAALQGPAPAPRAGGRGRLEDRDKREREDHLEDKERERELELIKGEDRLRAGAPGLVSSWLSFAGRAFGVVAAGESTSRGARRVLRRPPGSLWSLSAASVQDPWRQLWAATLLKRVMVIETDPYAAATMSG